MVGRVHLNLSWDFFDVVLVSQCQKVNRVGKAIVKAQTVFWASGCWWLWLLLSTLLKNGAATLTGWISGDRVQVVWRWRVLPTATCSGPCDHLHVDLTRSGGHSHPFILCCSLSLSSGLSTDRVSFVGHDLVRPRRSRLLVTGKVTLGHCAAVNFGQRDCWSAEASLSTIFGHNCK